MNLSQGSKAPLEDLMAAMDVVDTLRHQQGIAERELDAQGRRERLLQRLTQLYKAQGIEVPEHVLREGIDALEEERFSYNPVAPSWRTRLAKIWVSRSRWGKPVGFLAVLSSLFLGVYVVNDVLPERQLRINLPNKLETSLANIQRISKNPEIVEQARLSLQKAKQAHEQEKYTQANEIHAEMQSMYKLLQTAYSIRVISKPNENSGVWRVPDANDSSRNYYLIVEAVDQNNQVVELEVLSEESNKRESKKQWGLRVNEKTFYKVAHDKQDDGIIQANKVGEKPVGYLKPRFSIPTTGATITDW